MDVSKKKLAVIGASYLQLPLVEKARSLGLEVLCFAWEDGAVCRDIADRFYPVSVLEKEQIAEICRREQISGVTTIATDISVPTVCHVASELNLTGNTPESAWLSTNKFAMRQVFKEADVNCPGFRLITAQDHLADTDMSWTFPSIVKPCDRSGSMGVAKVESFSELRVAVEKALACSLKGEVIVEDFIPRAREISIEGISWNGNYHVLAVTDKQTTGSPHYVELAHHQPSTLPKPVIREAIRQARIATGALGIRFGASHAEFMIDEKETVYITEIGARMGGDFIGSNLVELSTGYDYLKAVVEVALGRFSIPATTRYDHSGVWFYSTRTKEVGDWIRNANRHLEIVQCEIQGPELRELTRSSDRSGYFIYRCNRRIEMPVR